MKVEEKCKKGDTYQDRNCRLGKMSQRGRINMRGMQRKDMGRQTDQKAWLSHNTYKVKMF
jgi:hypothetical protein